VLGCHNHGVEGIQPLTEHLASLREGNLLLDGGAVSEELAHLIERSAKAGRRGHASEPAHRIVALFDPPVILLQSIVDTKLQFSIQL
jgi:hypothetical protein